METDLIHNLGFIKGPFYYFSRLFYSVWCVRFGKPCLRNQNRNLLTIKCIYFILFFTFQYSYWGGYIKSIKCRVHKIQQVRNCTFLRVWVPRRNILQVWTGSSVGFFLNTWRFREVQRHPHPWNLCLSSRAFRSDNGSPIDCWLL